MKRLIPASALALVLVTLLMAPAAQTAINQPTRLDHQVRFADGFGDGLFVASGKLEARMSDARGGSAYKQTEGFEITRLAQVCWHEGEGLLSGQRCATSSSSSLSLKVQDGGSIGVKLPVAVEAAVSTPHALAIFSNVGSAFSPVARQQIGLSNAMVAAVLDGALLVEPKGGVVDATMVTLDDSTVVEIRDGDRLVQRVRGDDEILTFDGIPRIGSFTAQTIFIPFRAGATATFDPASRGAAAEGLKPERLSGLLNEMGDGNELDGLHEMFGNSLEDILNGALFGFPIFVPAAGPTDQLSLIRYDHLIASPRGDHLHLDGDAPLMLQGSRVDGAPSLLGIAWFVLPWWSYALWAVAIGFMAARLAVRPPKPEPGRHRWAAWLVGFVVFAGLLVLWDLEVRSLWGTSVGSAGDAGQAGLALFLAVQLYPLAYGLFAVAAPLRAILGNALRLSGKGALTRWAGPIANVVAFVPAALLYRAYLGELLARVGDALG